MSDSNDKHYSLITIVLFTASLIGIAIPVIQGIGERRITMVPLIIGCVGLLAFCGLLFFWSQLKLKDFAKEYWPGVLIVVASTFQTGAQFFFSEDAIKYWLNVADLSNQAEIVATFKSRSLYVLFFAWGVNCLAAVCNLFRAENSQKMARDLQSMEEDRAAVLHDLGAVLRGYLWGVAEHLKFDHNDRISLFSFDSTGDKFIPVERISLDTEFSKKSRMSLPSNEGFAGKAWRKGDCYVAELPEPTKKAYLRQVQRHCEIPDMVVTSIRMKSRCYFGLRISNQSGDKSLAVILVESLTPNRWSEQELRDYFNLEKRRFASIFERLYDKIPKLEEAKSRGF